MPPRTRLSDSDAKQFATSHSGWKLEEGELRKKYEFASFAQSMKFVNKVAELAEREDHHPDIDIRYKKVKIALVTYDADGVTKRDTELAEKIDSVFSDLGK